MFWHTESSANFSDGKNLYLHIILDVIIRGKALAKLMFGPYNLKCFERQ